MKERLLNILKWFFIILGIMFFIQVLLVLGAIIGITSFANFDFKAIDSKTNIRPLENIIKYLDEYNTENSKYPENIDEVKKDKKYDFEYKTTNDKNCYTLSAKSKNSTLIKEFHKCSIKSDTSSSLSQSYVEYNLNK